MKEFNSKTNYTNEEILSYCIKRKKTILDSCQVIDKPIIDELFTLEKLKATNTNKYYNQFEVDIYSSINVAKDICGNKKICNYFKNNDYEKQFRSIIKYFVIRFNINSDNNFYELEEIKSDFFKIKNKGTGNEFNVRRSFPSARNDFNKDPVYVHNLLGLSYQDDNNSNNKNILRLSDYYNKYGSYDSFGDSVFSSSLDWYTRKTNEYNLYCQEDFNLTINKLPINLYDQEKISIYFHNITENVIIENIYFYHKFVFKLYGKENKDGIYQEVNENNYSRFSKFLLIANTKSGVSIYESSGGLKTFDNVIVDDIKDIALEKNIIYLKSKEDYFAYNLEDTFFNRNCYSLYLTNNKHNYIARPSLALLNLSSNSETMNYLNGTKYRIFYISDDKSQKGDVLRHIINNIDLVEVEENIFSDDTSINYKIYVPENDIETMVVLDYLKRDLAPFKIYNISVLDIYHFMLKDNYFFNEIVPIYKKSIEKHSNAENNYFYKMQYVCNLIFNEIMKIKKLSFDETIDFLNNNYVNKDLLCNQFLNDLFRKLRTEKNEDYRQLRAGEEYGKTPLYYDKYVRKLDNIKIKWKSEKKLYDIVATLFPDAIYQFRDKWLNKQSLDIFIPSKKIAIEYQGIQHFKEVDYFGGKSHYSKQIENDNIKKQLCKENNITLIEWLYNDPISEILIKDKLGLLSNSNINNNMIAELTTLDAINNNKKNNIDSMINNYKKMIKDMENLIKSMKNIKETHDKELSHQTKLWYEAAMNNHNFDLDLSKKILEELNDNQNRIYNYIEIQNEKLAKLKEDLKYLRMMIKKDKSINTKGPISDSISIEYNIDDSELFDFIDETLANVDVSILEKARRKGIKKGESTEILDKAIKERKRRDKLIKKEQERKSRKLFKKAAFFGLLSGLFSGSENQSKKTDFNSLMPWEQNLVDQKEYELHHFEEENIDEDDYYSDDLD